MEQFTPEKSKISKNVGILLNINIIVNNFIIIHPLFHEI